MKILKVMICMIVVMAVVPVVPAIAALPIESRLSDSKQEAVAKDLFSQVHCAVCSGQSLADSHAALAVDMRGYIRRQVFAGKASDDILAELVASYGDEILMKPPFSQHTYLLWFGPGILMLLGMIGFLLYVRRGRC